MRARYGLALLCAACACSPKSYAAPPPAAPAPAPPPAPVPTSITHGVPPSTPIANIVLSPDGKSAVTVDSSGHTRLWPSLDGRLEPLALPVHDAQLTSLADPEGGAWRVGVIDSSGSAHVFAVLLDGHARPLGSTAPTTKLVSLSMLPGGRFVALGADFTIRVYADGGQVLAQLERRNFRPAHLLLAQDGRTLDAVIDDPEKAKVQRISLDLAASPPTMTLVGEPASFLITPAPPGTPPPVVPMAISPDGHLFAFVNQGVSDVLDLDAHTDTKIPLAGNHLITSLGFVGDTQLLVADQTSGVPFRIDLDHDARAIPELASREQPPQPSASPTAGAPAQPVAGDMPSPALKVIQMPPASFGVTPHAFGPGIHVAGHLSWLYVQDTIHKTHVYLGYQNYAQVPISLSPDGTRLATIHEGKIVIEPIAAGGNTVTLAHSSTENLAFVDFVDDDHLLTVDVVGGVRLLRISTDQIIGAADAGGQVAQTEVDLSGHLLRLVRATGDTTIFDLQAERLLGHMIADGSNASGLLTAGHPDAPILWTRDANLVERFYTRAQVLADASGAVSPNPPQQPLAVDRRGARYTVVPDTTTPRVTRTLDTGAHDVGLLEPGIIAFHGSPSGEVVIAGYSSGALVAYQTGTMTKIWSIKLPAYVVPVWNQDGSRVAFAGAAGLMVLDSATGEPLFRECGGAFVASITPPMNPGSGIQTANVCEP